MVNTWAIVAIPDENDYVWKLSSEPIPHTTLLFLGEQDDETLIPTVADFVGHVASTLPRFGLSVDHRGVLGPKDADVLFFSDGEDRDFGWSLKRLADVRSDLLKNDLISKLYNSTEQYPQWTPHLTMGYPETPAKPDNRDYPGISWINFNKLAFWTQDDSGVEFLLKDRSDLAMSFSSDEIGSFLKHKDFSTAKRKTLAKKKHALPDGSYPIENVADLENAIQSFGRAKNKPIVKNWIVKRAKALGATDKLPAAWNVSGAVKHEDEVIGVTFDEISELLLAHGIDFDSLTAAQQEIVLKHWGVKGMHWGIRKSRGAYRITSVDENGRTKKERKASEKIEVGKRQGPKGADGERISKQSSAARKAAREDTAKLTDQQLRERINRIKMEQEYAKLTAPQKSAGSQFVKAVLADSGKTVATKFVTDNANNAVAKLVTPKVSDVINKQAIKAGQRATAGPAVKSLAKTLAEAAAKAAE